MHVTIAGKMLCYVSGIFCRRCSSMMEMHHIHQVKVRSRLVISLFQDILQVSHSLQMPVIRLHQTTINCHPMVCSNDCGVGNVVWTIIYDVIIAGVEDV